MKKRLMETPGRRKQRTHIRGPQFYSGLFCTIQPLIRCFEHAFRACHGLLLPPSLLIVHFLRILPRLGSRDVEHFG